MSLKLIDPDTRYTWVHPEDDTVVFTYKALAGAITSVNLGKAYLNNCITKVEGVILPGCDIPSVWEGKPAIDWQETLPADVATAVFLAIAGVSNLSGDESKNSPSPLGSEDSVAPTTAPYVNERCTFAAEEATIENEPGNE